MTIWHIARLVRQLRPFDFSAVQIYHYMYLINSFRPNLKMQKGNKITFWQASIVLVEVALMHLKDKWRKGHVSQDLDAKKGKKKSQWLQICGRWPPQRCWLPFAKESLQSWDKKACFFLLGGLWWRLMLVPLWKSTQFKIFKKELHLLSPFTKTGNLFWPDFPKFCFFVYHRARTGRTV